MKVAYYCLVCAVGLGLSGCESASRALGLGKVSPDEFAVVTKAPLIIPPDFSLRPPKPGAPDQNQPDSAVGAQNTLYQSLADQAEGSASDGEIAFIAEAGATNADDTIRDLLNAEHFAIGRANRSFADRLLFWQENPAAPAPVVVDPEEEDEIQPEEKTIEDAVEQDG